MLSDLGLKGLFPSFKLLSKIAWMAAQSLGALGDEVVFPLLELSEAGAVLLRGLCPFL
ncbi:MAG: hypothetical protein RL015_3478 [Verrucomicrobiota bacterium]